MLYFIHEKWNFSVNKCANLLPWYDLKNGIDIINIANLTYQVSYYTYNNIPPDIF